MELANFFASEDAPWPPPDDSDYWYERLPWLPGHETHRVTPTTAMQVDAVNACVKVISETVAMLPLVTYKRLENGGKRRATDISLYHLLHDTPNDQQSAFEFREMLTGHVLLRGNGYAEIISDERGAARELIPVHPERVEVETVRVGGKRRRRYKVTEAAGAPRTILQDDMFHVRGLSLDGVTGVGVIEYARDTIALAQTQRAHGQALFSNGANPGGVLQHPNSLSEEAQKRLAKTFDRDHGGPRQTGKTMVLEEGMTWQQIGLKSVDAEWLDSMKFGVASIARFFRMQLHMIADLDRSTNNNIEQQGQEFVSYTMMPWFKRWEGAISRDLIIAPRLFFAEFLVDALNRGITKDRLEGYRVGREIGMYTPNDLLEKENMNPREDPGGDEYMTPMNMKGSNDPARDPAAQPPANPRPRPVAVPPVKRRAAAAHAGRAQVLAQKAAGRVLRREVEAGRKAAVKHAASAEAWRHWVDEFYREHAAHVADTLAITPRAAQAYTEGQAVALEAGGVIALETWETDHIEALTRLALEQEETDAD